MEAFRAHMVAQILWDFDTEDTGPSPGSSGVSLKPGALQRLLQLMRLDWALNSSRFKEICALGRKIPVQPQRGHRGGRCGAGDFPSGGAGLRECQGYSGNFYCWYQGAGRRVLVNSASLTEYATRSYMSLEGARLWRGHPRPGDLFGQSASDPRPRRALQHSGATPRVGASDLSTRCDHSHGKRPVKGGGAAASKPERLEG